MSSGALLLPEEEPPVPTQSMVSPSPPRAIFEMLLEETQTLLQRLADAHMVELANCQATAAKDATTQALNAVKAAGSISPKPRGSADSSATERRGSLRTTNSMLVPELPKKKSVSINLDQEDEPTVDAANAARGSQVSGVSVSLLASPTPLSEYPVDDPDNSEVPGPRRSSAGLSEGPSVESNSPRSNRTASRLMKQAREMTTNIEAEMANDSLDGALQLREEWDLEEDKLKALKRIQRRMSVGSLQSIKSTVKRQYLLSTDKLKLPCYVMHPNSKKRIAWDILAVFVILFEISFSPLHLYNMEDSFRETADAMQWAATSFWILDIPMSFLTAVYVNDKVRYRLTEIAKVYLSSWCFYDVSMLLPDLIVIIFSNRSDQPAGVLRLARFRRMFRLLRFFQLIRVWSIVESLNVVEGKLTFLRTEFGSLIRPVSHVLLLMTLAIHVLGSLWFAAGNVEGGWVTEEGLQTLPLGRQYTRSLEWALSRLPPSALRLNVELKTAAERWLGIFGTCMALICSSIFVSFVTNTMANVARERMRTTKILQSVRKYCSTHCISYSYTMQMKRYVEREHRRNELRGHMPMLQNLPEGMVRELFQEARALTLHSHAFFKEVGLADPSMELNLCSQAVTELYLLAGDIIFDITSKTEGMYMMANGVSIYFNWSSDQQPMTRRRSQRRSTTGSLFKGLMGTSVASMPSTPRDRSAKHVAQTVLEAGEYVAEPALWVKAWRHQGQLQAVVEARALLVGTEDLFKVLQGYANTLANAVVYARCFVQELNKSSPLNRQVTDLPINDAGDEEDEKPAGRRSKRSQSQRSQRSLHNIFGSSTALKVQPS